MQNGIYSRKLKTVCNAVIQIGDIDDTGKGRHFVSRFIKDGLVKIEGHGIVLLKKETLDASLPSMVGTPVIIQHQNVTKSNADKLRIGTISNAYFNEPDGWYYCEGIIWDDEAKDLIDKGWSVSCSYDFLAYNDEGGEENNIHYDKEFTQLNFTHLAIVDNPRYERANIVFNSKDEEKGTWVTIKGNHIFIPDGKTLDEVIKEKGWEENENKQSGSENKHGFKKDKDSGYYMKDLPDGTSVYVEKKEGGQGEKEPFFLEATHFDKDGKPIDKKQYHYDSMDGMFDKIDKDFVSKDKQPDSKGEKSTTLDDKIKEHENKIPKNYRRNDQTKALWLYKNYYITRSEWEKVRANNSKEQDMALLEELKKLITKVENTKGEKDMDEKEKVDNKKVDKRKLIDEVGGILKGKVDDEIIRTIIKKMEEASYNGSEDDKADNEKEEDKKDDKKEDIENKCKNETEEDKKEVKEIKEDVKGDIDNKCKNSKQDTSSFDKINKIYNSIKQVTKESKYVSRQEKLDNAVEYFKYR